MSTVIRAEFLDRVATAQNLEDIGIGTILHAVVTDYVAKYGKAHDQADATNTFTDAVPTDQATLNAFLNAFKAKINLHHHTAGQVHAIIDYLTTQGYLSPHIKADTDNANSTTAASDLATTIALANALKTCFNAHCVMCEPVHRLWGKSYPARRGAAHLQGDNTGTCSTAAATDLASAYTLVNALKGKVNVHAVTGGPLHRLADVAYALHRGAPHLQADATNVETTAAATDLASAYTLVNSLKAKMNAHALTVEPLHRHDAAAYDASRGAPHITADTTNATTEAAATDTATLYALLNALKVDINAHCAKTSGTHHVADATNTIGSPDATTEGTAVTLADEINDDIPLHCVDLAHGHYQADGRTTLTKAAAAVNEAGAITSANNSKAMFNTHIGQAYIRAKETGPITSTNASSQGTLDTLANELKADFNTHIASATLHYQADSAVPAITTADSSSEATGVALANAIKAAFNLHLAAYSQMAKETAPISSPDADDQAKTNTLLNEIKADFNTHIASAVLHYLDDTTQSAVATADSSSEATAIALANAMKAAYNIHCAACILGAKESGPITSNDASSQGTLNTLADELKADINTHLADAALHYQADSYTDPITAAASTSEATGVALANACKAAWNNHCLVYSQIPKEKSPVTSPDASDAATSYTLLNDIKATLNSHMIDATDHYQADTLNAVCATADAVDLSTSIALANALKALYNLHIASQIIQTKRADLITSAAATDLASSETLANEIKADLNTHFADVTIHKQADAQTISTANATTLATGLALAIACQTAYGLHIAGSLIGPSSSKASLDDKL